MTPIRVTRVLDHDTVAVVISVDPANVMVSLTARELTVTISPREADALAMALTDAAEARVPR